MIAIVFRKYESFLTLSAFQDMILFSVTNLIYFKQGGVFIILKK